MAIRIISIMLGLFCLFGCNGGDGSSGPKGSPTDGLTLRDARVIDMSRQTDGSIDLGQPDATPDLGPADAMIVAVCGDGVVQGDEACDDGNRTDGDGCDNNCTETACNNGVQTRGEACDDGNTIDGDGCDSNCTATACGNGILTEGEVCDDGNPNDGDGCDTNCTETACGNGVTAGDEACDDGNDVEGDGCDTNCTVTACGNGISTDGEACDDGNAAEGDGCDTNCTETACGNGIASDGETCDDGNAVEGDGCDTNCTVSACGNAIAGGDEACDDGNAVDGDGCDTNCTETACGNGIVTNGEACDDGNAVDTDACLNSCVVASCGDGVIQADVEACDDGNDVQTDGCLTTCVVATCGDGFVQAGVEACDDGNVITEECAYGEAACTICAADCTEQAGDTDLCGDGVMDAEEQCDDGNTVTEECAYGEVECIVCAADCAEQAGDTDLCGDGVMDAEEECDDENTITEECAYGEAACTVCAADCTEQPGDTDLCGDGTIDAEESCDDGNQSNTDLCTNACQAARCGDAFVQPGEECDDGDNDAADGCLPDCRVANVDNCAEACDPAATVIPSHDSRNVFRGANGTVDGSPGGLRGTSIAVHGGTAVFGMPRYGAPNAVNSGSVLVHTRTVDGDWDEDFAARLVAPQPTAQGFFGSSVSIYNNTVVVGAAGAPAQPAGPGSVHVFDLQADPPHRQELVLDQGDAADGFGRSVAVRDTLIVALSSAGEAFIFIRGDDGIWVQTQRIPAPDTAPMGFETVVLTQGQCLLGAPSDDGRGAVFVFGPRAAGDWAQLGKLTTEHGPASAGLGSSLAIHGDTALVGAPGSLDGGVAGQAHIYRRSADERWSHIQTLSSPVSQAGDRFGRSVAINETLLLAGGDGRLVHLYRVNAAGQWQHGDTLTDNGFPNIEKDFGYSVSLAERYALIGAPPADRSSSFNGTVSKFEFYSPICTNDGSCVCVEGAAGARCEERPACGDGVQIPLLEACDDGNQIDGDGCDNNCAPTGCGNGVLTEGEACDDGNRITEACAYGVEACTVCAADCTEQAGATALCGDGTVNPNEGCDDGNTVTERCDYGLEFCTVCGADCTEQAGETAACGDGVVDPEEACDDGNTVTEECDYGVEACTVCAADCSEQPGDTDLCGDGTVDAEEACDDSNTVTEECAYGVEGCTVCAADCTEQAGETDLCGDGTRDAEEACDDGNTVTEECDYGVEACTVCAADCTEQPGDTNLCGDGTVDAEETCDDSNTVTEECDYGLEACTVCAADCAEQAGETDFCGDTVLDPTEECDDGNVDNTDGCVGQCSLARCGDGYVQLNVEECDDQNSSMHDGCRADCRELSPDLCTGDCNPAGTLQVGVSSLRQALERRFSSLAFDGRHLFLGNTEDDALREGAVYIYRPTEDGQWQEVQQLTKPNNRFGFDGFGAEVAVDNDAAVISFLDSNVSLLYMLALNGEGEWSILLSQQGESDIPRHFDGAVTVRGDLAIAGSLGSARDEENGRAYLFNRDPQGLWTRGSFLLGDDSQFGRSVATDGGVIAIGGDGSVSIFEEDAGNGWIQVQVLTPGVGSGGRYGEHIALDGRTLVVTDPGHFPRDIAFVYERQPNGQWAETHRITPPAQWPEGGDQLVSVAVSGGKLLLGGEFGTVGFTKSDGGRWIHTHSLSIAGGDTIGKHLGLRGSVALAGDTSLRARESGAAFVFDLTDARPTCTSDGLCVCLEGADGPGCIGRSSCGDGEIQAAETCDDSNLADNDGCSPQCEVNDGWACDRGAPSNCVVLPTCEDGVQNGDETDTDCGGVCPDCEPATWILDYPAAANNAAESTYRVLVVMVNTLGEIPERTEPTAAGLQEYYSPEDLGHAYFEAPAGVRSFIREASYGKTELSGTVVGWFHTEPEEMDGLQMSARRNEYFQLACDLVDCAQFDIFVLNGLTTGQGRNTGWAMGNSVTVEQGTFRNVGIDFMINSPFYVHGRSYSDGILLPNASWPHELIHTLGISGHANSLWCSADGIDVALGGECANKAYGGVFSLMGENAYATHPDFIMKEELGWLGADSIEQVDVTAGFVSTRHTIYPLVSNDGRTKGVSIRLPRPIVVAGIEMDRLHLEYRTPDGLDEALLRLDGPNAPDGGSFLRRYTTLVDIDRIGAHVFVDNQFDNTDTTWEIDTHPGTAYNPNRGIKWPGNPGRFADAILNVGEVFRSDMMPDVEVEVLGLTADGGLEIEVRCIGAECSRPLCGEGQRVENGVCVFCEAGTVRPAGDDPAGQNTQCIDVPCPQEGSVGENFRTGCRCDFINSWRGTLLPQRLSPGYSGSCQQ